MLTNYIKIKRIIDFILSLSAIVILLPLFIIVSIIIKCESKGPVVFKQRRIGKNKKEFYIYKFRTMKTDAPKDVPTHLFTDAQKYLTKFGNFIRKTSIDELPQLLNILKGDMAIVGPRPALWNQYDLIEERAKTGANNVLPGLTGWAQINGRDELEIEEKAKYDAEYIQKMSFIFDLKIILKTIIAVFKGEGIL